MVCPLPPPSLNPLDCTARAHSVHTEGGGDCGGDDVKPHMAQRERSEVFLFKNVPFVTSSILNICLCHADVLPCLGRCREPALAATLLLSQGPCSQARRASGPSCPHSTLSSLWFRLATGFCVLVFEVLNCQCPVSVGS